MRLMWLAVSVSLIWLPTFVLAQLPRQMMTEAVDQYLQAMETQDRSQRLERFRHAGRLFTALIDDHGVENADLYVNLGNASLQCQRLGGAILAYRRALALAPSHRHARQNLDHARQMLPSWVPRPPAQTLLDTFFVWHRMLSRSARSLIASLCFALAALAASIAIRWQRIWARTAAGLLFLIWIAMAGLPLWQWVRGAVVDEAIVTAQEVVARSADSDGAPPRFSQVLPGGTEVEIVQRRDGWVLLRLANGLEGWVRSSAVTPVAKE